MLALPYGRHDGWPLHPRQRGLTWHFVPLEGILWPQVCTTSSNEHVRDLLHVGFQRRLFSIRKHILCRIERNKILFNVGKTSQHQH